MKRRALMLGLVLAISASGIVGCGSSESEKAKETASEEQKETKEESEEDKEQKEMESWLEEARDQWQAEKLKETKTTAVTVYKDGSEETSQSSDTKDSEKQVLMAKSTYGEDTYTSFYAKEGDKIYRYQDSYDNQWVKVLEDGEEASYYEKFDSFTLPYENAEERMVTEYSITNEREGDGVVQLRVIVKYKENTIEQVTKESVLKKCDLTEKDLQMLDGAAEALDAYIKENGENLKLQEETVYEQETAYWLTTDEHKLAKTEGTYSFDHYSYTAENAFWEFKWKLSTMKDLMKGGMSQAEAASSVSENESTQAAEIKEYKTTTEYITGEECTPLEELPENAKEITREQFENGEY